MLGTHIRTRVHAGHSPATSGVPPLYATKKKKKVVQQMKLLSKEREFKVDLKGLSLNDLLNKMNEENYFQSEQGFYLVKVVNKNQIIFAVPRNKVTPREIHNFRYLEDENKIQIKSKYKNWFFPSFLLYVMPSLPIVLGWNELTTKDLKIILPMLIGITLFISIFAFTSLNESSKLIERELSIRAKYLLRKKGYRAGI